VRCPLRMQEATPPPPPPPQPNRRGTQDATAHGDSRQPGPRDTGRHCGGSGGTAAGVNSGKWGRWGVKWGSWLVRPPVGPRTQGCQQEGQPWEVGALPQTGPRREAVPQEAPIPVQGVSGRGASRNPAGSGCSFSLRDSPEMTWVTPNGVTP
jgi:hypothetical protein